MSSLELATPASEEQTLRQELVVQDGPALEEQIQQQQYQAVRESLRIALQASLFSCGRCWILLILGVVVGAGCIVIWSENVYDKHHTEQCDQPLASMLRLFYIIGLVNIFQRDIIRCFFCYNLARDGPAEPTRVIIFRRCCRTATMLWPIVGAWMLSSSTKCSVDLQNAVRAILIYYVCAAGVVLVLPAVFISFMLCLVRRGLVRAPVVGDAAPEGFIDELPIVTYDPHLFDDAVLDGYPSTCPICLENFDGGEKISQTPCNIGRGHAFHTECLRGWLRCSKTCPLCRVDLTDPTGALGGDADSISLSAYESPSVTEV